jgi:uncharacterized phosphosugar-binding protein
VSRLVDRLVADQWPHIVAAAEAVVGALASGGTVHAFGTGHSHVLAEELYYRAGGLVRVEPILFDGLMLHTDARRSTSLERLPGLADVLVAHHPVRPGDVVVIASNSGGNAVTSELATEVRRRGAIVVAVTSLNHATSDLARATSYPRLHEVADIVIDNGGAVGDAAVAVEGFEARVGPTSTVVGAAVLNAVVAGAVGPLVAAGPPPEVYTSSSVEGGDEANSGHDGPARGGDVT